MKEGIAAHVGELKGHADLGAKPKSVQPIRGEVSRPREQTGENPVGKHVNELKWQATLKGEPVPLQPIPAEQQAAERLGKPPPLDGGRQGEDPNAPTPPNHEQPQSGERARSSEVGPFKLYRDANSRTNWTLEAVVDGLKWSTAYSPHLLRFTREEFIERLRESRRIIEEDEDQQKPEQGSEPHQ